MNIPLTAIVAMAFRQEASVSRSATSKQTTGKHMNTRNWTASLFLTLISITTTLAQSPTLDWAYRIGAASNDAVIGQTTDQAGNLYTVGYFSGTMDLNPGPGFLNVSSAGGTDIFIQKMDASGNFIWGKRIGGIWADRANDVAVDNSGNVLVTGSFQNTVDFDPGSGVLNMVADNSIQSSCVFVLKLNSSGAFQWAKKAETTTIGYAIDTDNAGNVYSAGYMGSGWLDFNPGSGTSTIAGDIFFWKLDASGNYVWAKALYDANSSTALSVGLHGMKVDDTGNVYATGTFDETQDFVAGNGVYNLVSNGSHDAYLLKLDNTGTFQWVKQFGGTSLDYGLALHRSANGDLYIAGIFSGISDFDPGSGTGEFAFQSAGSTDIFALKTDANGNVQWASAFGGSLFDYVGDISANAAGEVVVTGFFQGTADFDPDLVGTLNYTAVGGEDIFIEKLSATGELQWARTFGSTNDDNGWSILCGSGNSIYAGGEFYSTIDFDPSSAVYNLTSAAAADMYMLKFGECLATTSTINATSCGGYTSPSGNYTWTTTDTYTDIIPNNAGCDSIITINLTIQDAQAPIPDLANLSNVTAQCEVNSLTVPTATDNCAGAITGTHNASFPISASTTITWTYDDGNGNTSTQTQNVVINDVTAPVADLGSLANVTAQCSVTSLTAPTATDNCAGSITGTHNASFPITSSTTITWTYDDGNGNTSTQTQNVVINDVTAPVPNAANLADVNDQCAVSSLTPPTATDNCAGTITGTHNAQFPITSSATVTWTFDDGNGNTSTQTQNVVINDFTAPVPDAANLADVTNQCEVPFLTAPTATDNCAGSVTGTHNASLPISSSVVVTWTFNDGNGNLSTQTQNVVINDVTAPVPAIANLSAIADECEINSLTAPTANDNCAGTITGSGNASFPITASTTITWTYDDGNGNTSTQTQDVVITPIINSITQIDPITLTADASGYAYQWVDCNNGNAPIQGETAQDFTATSNGSYAVEIDNGNCSVTSDCIQIMTVGIDEKESNSMVYASLNQLTIILQDNVQSGQLALMDISGRLVLTTGLNSNRTSLEINLPVGIYLIRIETEKGIDTHKIAIN